MPEITTLLENYGRVAALCQRLELGCAMKLVVIEDILAWGRGDQSAQHRKRLKELSTRTLGQSIQLVAEALDLPEWRSILQPAIDVRNELHHRFFIDHDIEDPDIDVATAVKKLQELEAVLDRAHRLVYKSVEPILSVFEGAADGA